MADFDIKRRKFLAQSLYALGIMMLPFPRSMLARAATTGKRQHLINILDIGGWETNFTLNYMDPSLQTALSDPPADFTAINFLRYGSTSSSGVDKVVHPTGGYLAPGMKFWTATDFNRTMIIRGIDAVAGHGQHQFIYGGGTSPYMASYSAIIAGYQADTRGAQPLHYVKLASGTRTWIHSGMMTGVAVPSLLPDYNSFRTLTTPRATGTTATEVDILEQGIADLNQAAVSKLTRDASKGIVNGYMNGYSASVLLSSSGYASSAEFLDTWLRYFNAFKQEAASHLSSGVATMGDLKADISGQGYAEQGFVNLFTPLSTAALTSTTIKSVQANASVEFARNAAWKFAMAEFLIIKDLSAVVDISPSGNDSHTKLIVPGLQNIISLAGMRELTRKLAVTPNPDGGGMLLDCTLITYGSEFDRDGGRWAVDQGKWGTNHGNTFSMMMSGHRSNMGKLIGSVTQGEQASGVFKGRFGNPIPFSPTTGELGVGGVSAFSIFPTVLTMMGVPIPLQQVTESKAVPIFIKS